MDHREDQREKFQKYKLEILAGNTKKVDSVRFGETGKRAERIQLITSFLALSSEHGRCL
jgi:hypothetical protein